MYDNKGYSSGKVDRLRCLFKQCSIYQGGNNESIRKTNDIQQDIEEYFNKHQSMLKDHKKMLTKLILTIH